MMAKIESHDGTWVYPKWIGGRYETAKIASYLLEGTDARVVFVGHLRLRVLRYMPEYACYVVMLDGFWARLVASAWKIAELARLACYRSLQTLAIWHILDVQLGETMSWRQIRLIKWMLKGQSHEW